MSYWHLKLHMSKIELSIFLPYLLPSRLPVSVPGITFYTEAQARDLGTIDFYISLTTHIQLITKFWRFYLLISLRSSLPLVHPTPSHYPVSSDSSNSLPIDLVFSLQPFLHTIVRVVFLNLHLIIFPTTSQSA